VTTDPAAMQYNNTNRKRVLILSDSLALPRHIPENVVYEDTWVELFRSANPNSIISQLSIGGATIDKLWSQYFYHKNFRPDICIIQCGIVDCSPRALTEFEQYVINSNRYTRKIGNLIIPKVKGFLRKNRYIQLTSHSKFRSTLELFKAEKMKTVVVGIIPAPDEYNIKVPGILENITHYNKILEDVFGDFFIDTNDIKQDCLMSDFHHLNKKGHAAVFEKIQSKIYLK
jgi:hypothetical protein